MITHTARRRKAVRRIAAALLATTLGLLATLVAVPLSASAATTITPGNSAITYVGRWDKSSSTEYVSYWGGAYLKVDFSGTSLALRLGAASDLFVSIDGGADVLYAQATSVVNVTPTALAGGWHSLRVTSKFQDDQMHFQGLDLDNGAGVLPAAISPKSIEFIGDSITAGFVNGNRALSDYAWLTGEQLHVEHTQIAYSGICLVNVSCYPPNTTGMSAQFLKREPITAATQTNWNFATYQPTLVVINLGTNDGQSSFGVSSGVFQSAYVAFLQSVRSKYPNAEIFAMKTFHNYFPAETLAAVNTVIGQGDSHLHFVDTTGWTAASDFAPPPSEDTIHPIDVGMQTIATKLSKVLAPYLYPQNVSGSPISPVLEDFRNTSDWVPDDGNAEIYTTGTSAVVSLRRDGAKIYGSVAKEVTYNVTTSPFLSIRVNGLATGGGALPAGQWGLKVNDGTGADTQLQGVSSQTGLMTYDLRGTTGWSGTKTFKIKIFVLNSSMEVSELSNHSLEVARGATVTASSTVNGNVPGNITDGNSVSRWESATTDNEWITIDLGRDTTVDSALIRWEFASAKTYAVQTSRNNVDWSTQFSTTAGPGDPGILFPAPVTARYVRILMSQRATQYAYSIYEVELYRHDLAVGAPVVASSSYAGNVPQYAVDNTVATRWESAYTDEQGIILDLGSRQTVGRIVLDWEAASAKNFDIRVSSDGAAWTVVKTVTNGPGGPQNLDFASTTARYVMVYMTQRNTGWGYSLYGVEVYSH